MIITGIGEQLKEEWGMKRIPFAGLVAMAQVAGNKLKFPHLLKVNTNGKFARFTSC